MKKSILAFTLILLSFFLSAENGYDCWLRYTRINEGALLQSYRQSIRALQFKGDSETMQVAKKEILQALKGVLASTIPVRGNLVNGTVLVGSAPAIPGLPKQIQPDLDKAGPEGFVISTMTIAGKKCTVITGNTEIGTLYGVFHFLRLLQTRQPIESLHIVSAPRLKLRLLNHWDNVDRYVERGYAGLSIWNWHNLPLDTDDRYIDYARLNASIGINGTVLNNVNANAIFLTWPWLEKVKAIAQLLRPYGLKVYLSARFSSPIELGGLKTADPLDPQVKQWWEEKVNEIYSLVPDFGGFLVKANSEGQPGPQNYGRSHAEGANMLADALAPHKGVVIWRAFVYSNEVKDDRHKQAFNEFVPLDGKFRQNVLLQVKNGPIDFMPREPFHPLFGAMPHTPMMMEFQLTQEYLGQGTHLVYLAPLFKECLSSDTYSRGAGSTVAKVIDGSLEGHSISGMAGVSNIGNEINWTGHPFAQANWYALGRLSWDHELSSEQIASEWIRMSFTNDDSFVKAVQRVMLSSREILVEYMNPLGLHHIMATGHHYGPAPWVSNLQRPEWNPVYYHRADSSGIGFDRTSTGSNALAQYQEAAAAKWKDLASCDERYLLWFHHVSWDHRLKSGRGLWEELCHDYSSGVDSVRWMKRVWREQQHKVDEQRHHKVSRLLDIQEQEALWWRNACLLYFQQFAHRPIPAGYEQPGHDLKYYEQLSFPFAPGN